MQLFYLEYIPEKRKNEVVKNVWFNIRRYV